MFWSRLLSPCLLFRSRLSENRRRVAKTTLLFLSRTVDLSQSRGPRTGLLIGRSDGALVFAAFITQKGRGTLRKP